jgi:hypothetical protein
MPHQQDSLETILLFPIALQETFQKGRDAFRQHRCQTKPTMDLRPNQSSRDTWRKEMVFRFSIFSTQSTNRVHPINKNPSSNQSLPCG